jgi:hypothetical protein
MMSTKQGAVIVILHGVCVCVPSELSARSCHADSCCAYFLEVLSVCHTVVVETDERTGNKSYQVGGERESITDHCTPTTGLPVLTLGWPILLPPCRH